MNCNSSLDSASSHLMMSWILWSSMLLVMLPVTGSMVVCRGGAVANVVEVVCHGDGVAVQLL